MAVSTHIRGRPAAAAILPPAAWRRMVRCYRSEFAQSPVLLHADGRGATADPLGALPAVIEARRHAIAESLRWGECYIFLVADGVLSWAIALVSGETLRGGVCGGETVLIDDPLEVEAAVDHLTRWGGSRAAVRRHLVSLPHWPRNRVQEAAESLRETVYAVTGWQPERLRRNHADALQQRQIAEAIHQGKERPGARRWPLDEERRLLLLVRAGDHNGARRHLNNLLAAMFLDSPRLPVLKARVLELLGYLTRVAVEDAPGLEGLMTAHQSWMERIIGADSFDALCQSVRDALDAFLTAVTQQGLSPTNLRVRRALEHAAQHAARAVPLDEAAAVAGISRFRLSHLVQQVTGLRYGEHVKRLRIAEACRLLESTNRSGAEIASELGFADQSHFVRQFKQVVGLTPARYRHAGPNARAPE